MLPHALLQLFCGLHARVLLSVSVQNEFTVRGACFRLAVVFFFLSIIRPLYLIHAAL